MAYFLQVDGVYVANVADQTAEPALKLLGGLQAVLFNIHVIYVCLYLLRALAFLCFVCVRVLRLELRVVEGRIHQ
jgi:hypothetical protein